MSLCNMWDNLSEEDRMVDAHSFALKRNSEYLAGRSSARLFQNTAP